MNSGQFNQFANPADQSNPDHQPRRLRRHLNQSHKILHEPQFPLPQLDSILREKLERQLNQKMSLETNLPSIGSISILNSYRQVNCVTLSDSGAVMAVGQSNSTVKVFILSKKEHDILTVDDMIKQQVADALK